MIRLVLDSAEGVTIDYEQRYPGRGAYLCFNTECLLQMKKQRGLDRAFRRKVLEESYAKIEAELMVLLQRSKIESLLGFANKARKLVIGSEAVEQVIRRGKARFVLIAHDATENTRRKIQPLCERQRIPWKNYGQKIALGALLGKAEIAVLAIVDPMFAQNIAKVLQNESSHPTN